ncbi:MAG TPA: 2-phospho-L-lactate transferase CofD family protein [Solirubrobacteraceae bacterium]|nr:2-phospho-L-lactate transferase CofD family protein [Solirubrobacteraceae bacterium]
MSGPVVVLAGGTGGAKLARGMADVVAAEQLSVIANTGDDIEIYGAYVSPDPDLITFWLADRIDRRGWGLDGDTFCVMDGLRELGEEVWFHLGDRDMAIGLRRAAALRAGARPTEAQTELATSLGARGRVLPMSDTPVRTWVLAGDQWWTLQEYLIQARREDNTWPDVCDVQFRGAGHATITPEVKQAIAAAEAVIIGPSNPIISIGPMLALRDLETALRETRAPVVAVSPLVDGEPVKGPTAAFMRWRGVETSVEGVADVYAGLVDGLVADQRIDGLPVLETDLMMKGAEGRGRLAAETLRFAIGLGQRAGDKR